MMQNVLGKPNQTCQHSFLLKEIGKLLCPPAETQLFCLFEKLPSRKT